MVGARWVLAAMVALAAMHVAASTPPLHTVAQWQAMHPRGDCDDGAEPHVAYTFQQVSSHDVTRTIAASVAKSGPPVTFVALHAATDGSVLEGVPALAAEEAAAMASCGATSQQVTAYVEDGDGVLSDPERFLLEVHDVLRSAHGATGCTLRSCQASGACTALRDGMWFKEAPRDAVGTGADECAVVVVPSLSHSMVTTAMATQQPVSVTVVSKPFQQPAGQGVGFGSRRLTDVNTTSVDVEFVRMTPDIATGLLVSAFLIGMLLVTLSCLFDVKTPSTFVSAPLPPGKEF